ncbi:Uncharacterised protein [Mycoplasmopsis californica]|uniref:Uncharacterized protein n=1 Tax=Mycoplasmopsis equigenitalium TaxID=114883 RepID=A0ABY5J1Y2_9BACT|nr:hypothetical protein [Mycoplasmopsis equigenitalium]UUD37234.1 hypothetical protein NPA09_01520 [Mycoplasmopsis equigenitalium]VEU69458.1 Uncharacterised protein [Mycoplasmopsis californica]
MSSSLNNLRINYVDGRYWIVPSIFTFSRRKWASFPFKNLDLLFEKLDLNIMPTAFNFNGDKTFKHFNDIQKKLGYLIKLENQNFSEKSTILLKIFENLFIKLDEKSIKLIRSGRIFGCPKHYFEHLLITEKVTPEEKLILTWRKNYFIINKEAI